MKNVKTDQIENVQDVYLTPLNPLSVLSSFHPFVRLSARFTFRARRALERSTGARKKPPIGGLNFLVLIREYFVDILTTRA